MSLHSSVPVLCVSGPWGNPQSKGDQHLKLSWFPQQTPGHTMLTTQARPGEEGRDVCVHMRWLGSGALPNATQDNHPTSSKAHSVTQQSTSREFILRSQPHMSEVISVHNYSFKPGFLVLFAFS